MSEKIFADIELHNLKGRIIAAQIASEEYQENQGFLQRCFIDAYITDPLKMILDDLNEFIEHREI